ncbi:MAG: methylmalonyl-CoA mutase family protein [Promethearchaeota archaeon]
MNLEVGTSGVPLYCIDSLYALCDGLPVDKISVALVVEPLSSAPVCSFYFNFCKAKGYDLNKIAGTCQNDICTLSGEIKRCTGVKTIGYIPYKSISPINLLKLACDLVEWCTAQKNVPKWHPINFTGYS